MYLFKTLRWVSHLEITCLMSLKTFTPTQNKAQDPWNTDQWGLFLERDGCAGYQTGDYKSSIPCQNGRKSTKGIQSP